MRLTYLFPILLVGCGRVGPLDSGAAGAYGDVFLYAINANPAASVMTLRGDSGRIVKDLAFGERSGTHGLCAADDDQCLPHLVSRTDAVLKVKFDGAASALDLRADLRAMYPQETGTVIVTGAERALVIRHAQSISSACGLRVANALAVEHLDTDAATYSIALEIQRDLTTAGYFDESTTAFQTTCGPLPTASAEHAELIELRGAQFDTIVKRPWFFPVSCGEESAGTCYAWSLDNADARGGLEVGGEFLAARDTASYYDCVEGALTVTACGATPRWDDIEIDRGAVARCNEPVPRTTAMIAPQTVGRFSGDDLCDAEFRVRTATRDVVFGPQTGDDRGTEQNGDLVRGAIDARQGSEVVWLLYGRPVNPRVWTWNSSDLFVDLASYDDQD